MKKYVVTLTAEERQQLEQLLAKGKAAARTLAHAHVLLHADQAVGETDAEIAETFGLGVRTVERVRQRFVEEGLEAALKPKSSPRLPRKVDGDGEAHLIALTCSDPRRAGSAGRCGCWPTSWSNSSWSSRSRTSGCVRCSKKRVEALAEEELAHPTLWQR